MKDALVPIYIMAKDESQMPFVADNLIAGMFFTEDPKTQAVYKEGFQWVVNSSNEEATQNLVDSFVEVGNRYKQYGADKMATQVLNQVLGAKQASDAPNKDQLIKIVEEGLGKIK
mgnify:FL=1